MFVPESQQNADFRPLGFAVNPFVEVLDRRQRVWLRQHAWSAAASLLAAVVRASGAESRKPILVLVSPGVPDAYYREAENRFLAMSAQLAHYNMLALNIPLEMMRLGRTRGTLAEVAELVAAVDFERTFGSLCAAALAEPDRELDEWTTLEGRGRELLALVLGEFADDPVRAVLDYFGPEIADDPGVLEDAEISNLTVGEAYLREGNLDREPDEDDDAVEETSDDQPGMGWKSFREATADEGAEIIDVSVSDRDVVRDYLLSYTRTHISPVVARAVRAYEEDGIATVAGELKVTRAPKKTLRALARLIRTRWDAFAVIHDRFDPYPGLDEAGRAAVLAGLTELRWTLAEDSVFGLLLVEGTAPEVEEQFGSGEVLRWTFARAQELYGGDLAYDPELVQSWLDAASISTESPIPESDEHMQAIAARSGMDLEAFIPAAARAFASAAARGVTLLDDQAVEDAFVTEAD